MKRHGQRVERRMSKRTGWFGKTQAQRLLEGLEQRILFSLLADINPGTPNVFYDSGGQIQYSYNASLGYGVLQSNPTRSPNALSILMPGDTTRLTIARPQTVTLNIRLDANGNLYTGPGSAYAGDNPAGSELIVAGNVDTDPSSPGYEYPTPLLTGDIVAFGYADGTGSDSFNFRFRVTGGSLADPTKGNYFANMDIGMTMNSLVLSGVTSFAGDFTAAFREGAQGFIGPVAKQVTQPPPSGVVEGYVYADGNNDGARTGDAGIAGVNVTLNGTTAGGTIVPITVQTDASGHYQFTGLAVGTYSVTEAQPAGYLDGKDTPGTINGTTVGSAATPSVLDQITGIVLADAQQSIENNFGEILPASIAGNVFYDANNDGSRVGDAGISGATITLAGTDDLGNTISLTTSTDGTGAYSFTGLRPGTYTISESQPTGYLDGQDAAGSLGGVTTNDQTAGVVVAPGNAGVAYNFGEILPASIAGNVFYDANNDGSRTGDAGIGGATITLTGTDDLGNAINLTTSTDGAGAYSFAGLRPGTYSVTETQPAGYLDGKDSTGNLGGITTNDQTTGIVVASAAAGVEYNFGEIKAASISGVVFYDANNDGSRNGDTGIGGATITLAGTDDLGNAISLTTSTDGTGAYSFAGLRPGTYSVTEAQPAAYLDGKDSTGTLGGVTTNDKTTGIVVASGNAGVEYNFGEIKAASISGVVFYDANNDGSRTGDAGIAGVNLFLNGTNDLGQAINLTTTTDSTGAYSFTGLRPGSYTVVESQPANYLDGKDSTGNLGGVTTNDQTAGIVVESGNAGAEYNFGEISSGSIAGNVFVDANNDGSRVGDAGISGASITLTGTDDLGNAISLTTSTDGTGAYSFTGLRPGTYNIVETQPAGYLDGKDSTGSLGGITTNDLTSSIVVTPAANGVEYNFGELLPGSLSGVVYSDLNNDGTQQAGEAGISNVTLTLTGVNDLGASVSLTTTTAANGTYSFTNLRPGTYTVTETQPAGYLDGQDARNGVVLAGSNTTDVVGSINVIAGGNAANNNFGELLPGSLSGYVFYDANNDGSRVGDVGIANASVTLTGSNDFGPITPITVQTNASGLYNFTSLRSGTYTITESQPAGYLDGKDSAGTLGGVTTNDQTSGIVLAAAAGGTEYNFGEIKGVTITGTKYLDVTGNGLTADDTPLAGTTINLYRESNGTAGFQSTDTLVTTATTGADGVFTFANQAPGVYYVQEVVASGYLRVYPTNTDYYTVNAANGAGQTFSGNNFANFLICNCASRLTNITYTINGSTVVTDLRGNTHEGDVVTANFTVTGNQPIVLSFAAYTAPSAAFDANTAAQQQIEQVVTASYAPGAHSVTIQVPNGYYQVDFVCGYPIATLGPAGSNIFYTPQGRLISADNGGTASWTAAPANVSGFVYVDANNNGAFDAGETPLANATVTLSGLIHGVSKILTRTTDATGAYSFLGLPAGTYTITETTPAGYGNGKNAVGKVNNITVGAISGVDAISNVVLGAGQSGVSYNFGELVANSSVSGLVWRDDNGDGQVDFGEAGIGGVTITLTGTDSLGRAVTRTTTTSADGTYYFGGLLAGTYKVSEAQPAGYIDGLEDVGTVNGVTTGALAGNDVIGGITLPGGAAGVNYNFGEILNGGAERCGDSATIGFWQNKNGQALIRSLNGGASSTALGNWLATTFANLYGAGSGNNLAGKTNDFIANYFVQLFGVKGQKTNAQVLAVALASYVTDSSIAGTAAVGYGFNVSTYGLGSRTINVGTNGAAFGVANNSVISVIQALQATDDLSGGGTTTLYHGSTSLQNMANTIYSLINQTGDIV